MPSLTHWIGFVGLCSLIICGNEFTRVDWPVDGWTATVNARGERSDSLMLPSPPGFAVKAVVSSLAGRVAFLYRAFPNSSDLRIRLSRMNPQGHADWTVDFLPPGPTNGMFRTAVGYAMHGYCNVVRAPLKGSQMGFWIIAVSDEGRALWTQTSLFGVPKAIAPCPDGGLAAIASTWDSNLLRVRLGFITINAAGVEAVPQPLDSALESLGFEPPAIRHSVFECDALTPIPGQGFLLSGRGLPAGADAAVCAVAGLNSAGQPQWKLTYPEFDATRISYVGRLDDGNFLIAGEGHGLALMKIQPGGEPLWTQHYSDGLDSFQCHAHVETAAHDLLLAGNSSQILKLDADGVLLARIRPFTVVSGDVDVMVYSDDGRVRVFGSYPLFHTGRERVVSKFDGIDPPGASRKLDRGKP
jgi:hypothetical protein